MFFYIRNTYTCISILGTSGNSATITWKNTIKIIVIGEDKLEVLVKIFKVREKGLILIGGDKI